MTKALTYETTPFKVGSSAKHIKNKMGDNALTNIGTGSIVWHLVKRHKFGLVSMYAIVMTMNWMIPELPNLVLAVFGL